MIDIIKLAENEGLDELRSRLRGVQAGGRVAIVLPWDTRLLSRDLDCQLLKREAQRLGLQVAVVTTDPDRRSVLQHAGLLTFWSVEAAQAARSWDMPEREQVEPPPKMFWEAEEPPEPPRPARVPWLSERARQGVRLAVFVMTILVVLGLNVY